MRQQVGGVIAVIGLANRFQDMTRESDQISSENAGPPEAVPRAEQEAIQWVVRIASGEAVAADRVALAAWRAQSPEHEAALAMAHSLWLGVGQALPARKKARARPPRRQWAPLALAASLLMVVLLGYQSFNHWRGNGGDTEGLRSAAQMGADHAQPNRVMVVEVDGTEGRCRLTLGSGEGYFDVTPNPDRSIGGDAGETRVRMYDTAFSVKPEAAGVLVMITGGRVEVNDGNVAHVLTVGQQLRCRGGHDQAVIPAGPDVDGSMAATTLPGLSGPA